MTVDQVKSLQLGIAPINERTVLLVESALNWVLDNTTLKFDYNKDAELAALPAQVKLFICHYIDIIGSNSMVASESIEGLSHSFKSNDKSALLWDCAGELLDKWLTGSIHFVAAQAKWDKA